MNKILKSLLALLVLLTFSSCVMEVTNTNTTKKEKESIEFNFRSIKQLEGTELVVTLSSGGTIIDSKSQIIEHANEQIKFVFNNLLVGDTIKVKAAIIKDGLEIFTSSDIREIKSGTNEVNLTLAPSKVSLTLSPSPEFKLDTEELLGSKFCITVNGEEYEPVVITKGMTTVSTDIGLRKVGELLTIESKIVKTITGKTQTDVILYSCTKTTTVTKSENISLDLTRNSIKVSVSSMLPESVGLGSKLLGATYQITLNKGLNGERNVSYEIKELDRKIDVDLGYFDKDTVIKTISASVITKESPERGDEIILQSSTLENFKVTDNKDTEGKNMISLDLKIPLEVTVHLNPDSNYILGANVNIIVNDTTVASISITSDLLAKGYISHTIRIDNEAKVGVNITKENEILFSSVRNEVIKIGMTHISPELNPNSKTLQVSVTIPIADLTGEPYLSITDANGNKVLTLDHRFTITDASETTTTITNPFQVNVGEEIFIKIQNEIIKEPTAPNELITIFEGSHTIGENDNSIIDVNLKQIKKSIKIAPPSDIDLEQYRGNLFIVEANGKKESKQLGELPSSQDSSSTVSPIENIYIDLGYVSLDTPIPIKAEINNSVCGSPWSFNESITFSELSPIIYHLPSMTKNKGILLFGKEDVMPYVGFNYNSTFVAPTSEKEIQDNYYSTDYFAMAVTDNGDLWNLDFGGNNLLFLPHGNSHTKLKNYSLGSDVTVKDNLAIPRIWSGITPYKEGVFMGGAADGVQNFYYVYQNPENDTVLLAELYETSIPSDLDAADYQIQNIAISNDTIYISFSVRNFDDGSSKLLIYKGSFNEQSKQVSLNNIVFDSSTYTTPSTSNKPFDKFEINTTDLVVIENNLYALLLDCTTNGYANDNSRGALLKIAPNGDITCIGLHNTFNVETDVKPGQLGGAEHNIYMLNDPLKANDYFLGPRKFIAIKPDELVIADAGAISTDNKEKPNLLRKIKTVNLNDLTIKSSDIEGNVFGGSIITNQSGFGYSVN